jgi:hypothetical protein
VKNKMASRFAVVAGISYSVAREWFQIKGFPRVRGVIFGRISSNGVIFKMEENIPLKTSSRRRSARQRRSNSSRSGEIKIHAEF